LKQALEASGGRLPAEKMPQQLNDQQIAGLAKVITATADPARGEGVYRKSGCMTCHALGGAGGLIGPDLSSLGTSSPGETIIRSILYPTASIKEGYELQRFAKKDGSELLGYLVSNGSSEIVMRDVTGQEVSIPKSQLSNMEKVPGSLMPAGLTAGLDKEEFNDLVGFLSRLGESGDYRVPAARLVRRWEVVPNQPELIRKVRTEGLAHLTKATAQVPFQPLYSKVAGNLPVEELPVLELTPTRRYSVVRFEVEVLTPGQVNLALSSTTGLSAWTGQQPLKLTDQGTTAELPKGVHTLTLVLDRGAFKDKDIRVQLLDGSSAQTRLRMGR
jgi:putative heme-binding domain-containing protein